MELFTSEGLGCIASAVGKPLYLDKATAERRRVPFARIFVDAENEGNLPKAIEVEIERMGTISVRVEYPWGSQKYTICKALDHSDKDCKKGKKIRVPVKKDKGDAPTSAPNQVRVEKVNVPPVQTNSAASQGIDQG